MDLAKGSLDKTCDVSGCTGRSFHPAHVRVGDILIDFRLCRACRKDLDAEAPDGERVGASLFI